MYVWITILLVFLVMIPVIILLLGNNRKGSPTDTLLQSSAPTTEEVNNTPPKTCQVSFVGSCRQGWKKGSHQYGVGGIQWTTSPDACTNKFKIDIKDHNGTTTSNTITIPDKDTTYRPPQIVRGSSIPGGTIFSYAIQGRSRLPAGASTFRSQSSTWTITPVPSDSNTPVSWFEYVLNEDSPDRCTGYYCPDGQCN